MAHNETFFQHGRQVAEEKVGLHRRIRRDYLCHVSDTLQKFGFIKRVDKGSVPWQGEGPGGARAPQFFFLKSKNRPV